MVDISKAHHGYADVHFCKRSGIRETAKRLGLGDDVKVQLNRYVFTILSFIPLSSSIFNLFLCHIYFVALIVKYRESKTNGRTERYGVLI